MTRILYDTPTGSLVRYPRDDDGPVIGLDPRYVDLELIQEPQPSYDPATERLEPTEVINLTALTCTRGWAVMPLPPPAPPEPTPEWIAFSEAIVAIPAVQSVLTAAIAANPGLYGGLVVGLGQAAQGDPRTFLRFWQLSVAAGLITTQLATDIQALATTHHLPTSFIDGLQP